MAQFMPAMRGAGRFVLPCLVFGLTVLGCAQQVIPNTDVPDTPENRQVIDFVEKYRKAVDNRDVGEILALVSKKYLDDNGTPSGDDDLDYDTLKKQLEALHKQVKDVRYDIRYRRVTFRADKVLVDYTYSASFLVATPDGKERWARRLSDNRMVLLKKDGHYRILSGL